MQHLGENFPDYAFEKRESYKALQESWKAQDRFRKIWGDNCQLCGDPLTGSEKNTWPYDLCTIHRHDQYAD